MSDDVVICSPPTVSPHRTRVRREISHANLSFDAPDRIRDRAFARSRARVEWRTGARRARMAVKRERVKTRMVGFYFFFSSVAFRSHANAREVTNANARTRRRARVARARARRRRTTGEGGRRTTTDEWKDLENMRER